MNEQQKANLRLCLADLRSGEYPQGSGKLRTEEGWCCLGVFTDRFRKETGNGQWVQHDEGWAFLNAGSAEGGILPAAVQDWLGLRYNPLLPEIEIHGRDMKTATQYNDEGGASFEEIADAFEEQYLQ